MKPAVLWDTPVAAGLNAAFAKGLGLKPSLLDELHSRPVLPLAGGPQACIFSR